MTDFKIEVDSKEAKQSIARLAAFMTDMRPMWPVVRNVFGHWMSAQFETEGAFSGRPWAPLAQSTQAYKAQNYPGKPILVQTGELKKAATTPKQTHAGATELELTVDSEIAGFHQTGNDRLPARPIIFGEPLPPLAHVQLQGAIADFTGDLLKRLF